MNMDTVRSHWQEAEGLDIKASACESGDVETQQNARISDSESMTLEISRLNSVAAKWAYQTAGLTIALNLLGIF